MGLKMLALYAVKMGWLVEGKKKFAFFPQNVLGAVRVLRQQIVLRFLTLMPEGLKIP